MVWSNDVWYVVVREVLFDRMLVWFFECDQESFLYDSTMYDFEFVRKRTASVFVCKNMSGVTATVTPSTSHQLWFKVPFTNFASLPGVRLVERFECKIVDLPRIIHLNP